MLINETSNFDMTFKGSGEPVWTTDSKFGSYAIHFDGYDDYVNQSTLLDNVPNNGTIELWFKPDVTIYSSTDGRVLVHKENSLLADAMDVRFKSGDGRLDWHTIPNNKITDRIYSKTNIWYAGTWYHVAVTWGSNGKEIWVNGI